MYDIIFLGAGPGGYHASELAASQGKKVAVIEGNKFGGVCLNVGCIPTKTFLHFSNSLEVWNESIGIGIKGENFSIDQEEIVDYKDDKVKFLVKGTEMGVKKSGAHIFKGWGEILPSEKEGEFRVKVNDEILTTNNLVIATGSSPFVPNFIKGVDKYYEKGSVDSKIITSNEILSLKKVPKELVIVGAGVIGLELGLHFLRSGSNVTMIDISDRVAPVIDATIAKSFHDTLISQGIKFKLNTKVTEITDEEVIFENADGEVSSIKYDKTLLAIGRRPNLKGIGLENLESLEYDQNKIVTNNKLETNIPGVFAIGDVNGKVMLAHTAYKEGEVVVSNILGKDASINYDLVPWVIYGMPEIAEVGINEERAKELGIDYKIKQMPMLYSGRFVIQNPKYRNEFIKVILDKKDEKILGIQIYSEYASEIIGIATVLIHAEYTVDKVRDIIFAHPTIHEILKDVIIH